MHLSFSAHKMGIIYTSWGLSRLTNVHIKSSKGDKYSLDGSEPPVRVEHPGVLNGTKLQVLFSVEGNWEKIRASLSTHWLARA